MRPHCAIFVDVGYLLASAATRVTGTSLRRGIKVDFPALVAGLITQAETDSGVPLLRINWYDSGGRPGGMPDIHQEDIGLLPRVKLRLGRLSHQGEQKGVDLRIGLDLATHGRNRVVDVIYLVSGDDDLTEAVEEAQVHGIQVILLAVPTHVGRPHAVSRHLQRAADGVVLIDAEMLDGSVRPAAVPEALVPPEFAPATDDTPDAAAAAAAAATDSGTADGQPTSAPGSPGQPATPASGVPKPGPKPAAPAAPTTPEAAPTQPAAPGGPTPSVLAKKKATQILPPRPAWSSEGGGTMQVGDTGEITVEMIDEVVRQVVTSWVATATPDQLGELRAQKPMVPIDLDRTLLMDLSTRSGVYYIGDAARHELREQFWRIIDSLKVK